MPPSSLAHSVLLISRTSKPASRKRFAVFGSGDEEGYPDTFCAAVGIIEEKLSDLGATRIINGLKIDENDADEEKLLHNWADRLLDEANSEEGV